MLERCLGQACVAMLSSELEWFGDEEIGQASVPTSGPPQSSTEAVAPEKAAANKVVVEGRINMSFDLMFIVNSACPSLHAKMLDDFLRMCRSGLSGMNAPHKDVPVIVSVTSTHDDATGKIHPVGNLLAGFSRCMQRRYDKPVTDGEPLWQGYFYSRTAGHNPLLLNHWVVKRSKPEGAVSDPDLVFDDNLNMDVSPKDALHFLTSGSDGGGRRLGRSPTTRLMARNGVRRILMSCVKRGRPTGLSDACRRSSRITGTCGMCTPWKCMQHSSGWCTCGAIRPTALLDGRFLCARKG